MFVASLRLTWEALDADLPLPPSLAELPVFGFNPRGESIHSVWAYNEETSFAVDHRVSPGS